MIGCNLAGIQSIDYNFDFGAGEEVVVHHDRKWDKDDETALAIKLNGFTIGYIPLLSSIQARMDYAEQEKNREAWLKHRDIQSAVLAVRWAIIQDMFENHLTVTGNIYRVVKDDDGKVLSIGVVFDYM